MKAMHAITEMRWTPSALTLEWADGDRVELASVWLRDNLRQDRDPGNGQRLIDVVDLPPTPRIRTPLCRGRRSASSGRMRRAAHRSSSIGWRRRRRRSRARALPRCHGSGWMAAGSMRLATSHGRVSRPHAKTLALQAIWLGRLVTDGLAFLADVPTEPGAILETMPLVGQVAETNYGLLFDVRAVPEPRTSPISDRGSGSYRQPVPRARAGLPGAARAGRGAGRRRESVCGRFRARGTPPAGGSWPHSKCLRGPRCPLPIAPGMRRSAPNGR